MYFPVEPNRGEGYVLWQGPNAARLIFRLSDMEESAAIDLPDSASFLQTTRSDRIVGVLVNRNGDGTMRVSISGMKGAQSFDVPGPAQTRRLVGYQSTIAVRAVAYR